MKYENKVLTIDDNNYLVVKTVELEEKIFALITNEKDETDSSFIEIYEENENISIKAIDEDYFKEQVFLKFIEM